jgi:hypothetical protein
MGCGTEKLAGDEFFKSLNVNPEYIQNMRPVKEKPHKVALKSL